MKNNQITASMDCGVDDNTKCAFPMNDAKLIDQRIKTIGVVSCNINCNFTNYGSALQSWALSHAIERCEKSIITKLVDYCPTLHLESDPLNPIKKMWDQDNVTIKNIELSLPAIRENYYKFEDFYTHQFKRTKKKYTSDNFNDIIIDESIDGFVCGSDTIFCIDEWKEFDNAYFANYDCMRGGKSVAYAASFGDSHFKEDDYPTLHARLQNFKAIGIRENDMLEYVRSQVKVRAERVIDPTLLMDASDYEIIIAQPQEQEKYLLYYSRRYNRRMEEYADAIAKKNGWKVVDISIRATNADRHTMRYDAGVEEFLSLVKHCEYMVTNSFHGIIFSTLFRRPFCCFSREQGDKKIGELLTLFGLTDRLMINGDEHIPDYIDFDDVHHRIQLMKDFSLDFLKSELQLLS